MKRFYVQTNVGKARYVINFCDGETKHSDGSDFFHVRICSNKRLLDRYVKGLLSEGYKET